MPPIQFQQEKEKLDILNHVFQNTSFCEEYF